MFLENCKKLDFPNESLPVLEDAFHRLTQEETVETLFCAALDHLLNPNEVLYEEVFAKLLSQTKLPSYTVNAILVVSSLEKLKKIYEAAGKTDRLEAHIEALKPSLVRCKERNGVFVRYFIR